MGQEVNLSVSAIKFSILCGYKFHINHVFLQNNSVIDSSGNTLLHVACQYNISKVVEELMKCKQNPCSVRNTFDDTPLHVACANNSFGIVKILRMHGADDTACNIDEDTPLHVAAKHVSYQCIKSLGANPLHSMCTQNKLGDTPLHIACQSGSFSTVYYLIKHFDDAVQSMSIQNHSEELPLHIALKTFGKQIPSVVRSHSFCVLVKMTPNLSDLPQLIHLACQCKTAQNYKIAQHFRNSGVRIDVPDTTGKLPIHYASSETLDLVKVCVSNTTVNIQDNDGNTALHIACSSGKYDICKYLVHDKECDMSLQNKRGEVALHKACNADCIRLDVCMLLLEESSNIPDEYENYPLHYLCIGFNKRIFVKMIEVLNKAGSCESIVSHPNVKRELPLHFLCESSDECALNAIQILIPYTIDLNAKTSSGETPLHLACMNGQHDTIQLLAKHPKCNTGTLNAADNLPLHLACQRRILPALNQHQSVLSNIQEDHLLGKSFTDFELSIRSLSTDSNINAINQDGDTPLHILVQNDYRVYNMDFYEYEVEKLFCKILKTLTSLGASFNKKNVLNELPFHVACEYQSLQTVQLLEDCEMSTTTTQGDNFFHVAFRNLSMTFKFFNHLVQLGFTDF